jgi:hypothetical protein
MSRGHSRKCPVDASPLSARSSNRDFARRHRHPNDVGVIRPRPTLDQFDFLVVRHFDVTRCTRPCRTAAEHHCRNAQKKKQHRLFHHILHSETARHTKGTVHPENRLHLEWSVRKCPSTIACNTLQHEETSCDYTNAFFPSRKRLDAFGLSSADRSAVCNS